MPTICDGGAKCPSRPFRDVDRSVSNWYHLPVDWAVSNGITAGTSASTFDPQLACTRAQVVTFLWRTAGNPAPSSGRNPFRDVKSSAYYYQAVLWAVEKGITAGTSATTFSPDSTCTRGQVATFLWRFEGSPLVKTHNPFRDVSADAYYADAVLWAVEKGVTAGVDSNHFAPASPCTRAHVVTFLYRDRTL